MILLTIVWVAAVVSVGCAAYSAGARYGRIAALQSLQRYEASLREHTGIGVTPYTMMELPGLQAAIRYLLKVG